MIPYHINHLIQIMGALNIKLIQIFKGFTEMEERIENTIIIVCLGCLIYTLYLFVTLMQERKLLSEMIASEHKTIHPIRGDGNCLFRFAIYINYYLIMYYIEQLLKD